MGTSTPGLGFHLSSSFINKISTNISNANTEPAIIIIVLLSEIEGKQDIILLITSANEISRG